jgi:hypothetical protein
MESLIPWRGQCHVNELQNCTLIQVGLAVQVHGVTDSLAWAV